MKHVSMLLFAAALALAGVAAAQAFTFESAAPGDGGGARQNYTDPDEYLQPKAGSPQRFSQPGQDGQAKSGLFITGPTQSFDQKYNSNDFFNPMRR
jgi:hypothetical protein